MPAISLLFDFNKYSGLLLPFVLHGTIMTILLFRRGVIRSQLPDRLLGFLLLLYTLRVTYWMMGFAGWYDVRDWHTTFMFYFPFNHWLAVGPLIYLYFLSASNQSFRIGKKHLWHLLPPLIYLIRWLYIFIVDVVINSWSSGQELPDFYGTRGNLMTNGLGVLDDYWIYLETISILIYLIMTLRLFYRYRTYIYDHFSDTDHIDLRWLRNFLIVNLIGTSIWIGFSVANLFLEEPLSYIEDWYSFFFLGIILYYLGIAGYQNGGYTGIVPNLNFQPGEPDLVPQSSDDFDDQLRELFQQVEGSMQQDNLFLNSGLNLTELAKSLRCNPGSLSKSINVLAGKNFNDYVNGYRIEHFKRKLEDPENQRFSLLALAEDSGFNSKATFNRAFKKEAGVSPSAYLKANQKK